YTIGKNMYASHLSLKNDYNISCPEIDLLVNLTKEHRAPLGAKMCGKGFGGSLLVLLDKNRQNDYIEFIKKKYLEKTNKKLQIIPVSLVNGIKIQNDVEKI
ncbi:MAG TPA: galactokinase, partial [Spirochaetota bacterium]|nr:galactokinase [Spirochaetota bacterium]